MMKGGHGRTNQLHDINWDAFDHASRAPQLMSCNYYQFILFLHYWCIVNKISSYCKYYTMLLGLTTNPTAITAILLPIERAVSEPSLRRR